MTEENKNSDSTPAKRARSSAGPAAAKSRRTGTQSGGTARKKTEGTPRRTSRTSSAATGKSGTVKSTVTSGGAAASKAAESSAADAAETAKQSAKQSAASAAESAVEAGHGRVQAAGRVAARQVDAGRRAAVAVSQGAVTGAVTAWKLLRARGAVAAGAGASAAALVSAGYAVGRRTAARGFGPVTRITRGRI